LSEAAHVSGASPARAWAQVVFRLVLPSFLVSGYLAAVAISGSLDIPLLLGGPGLNTLSTTVYTLNTRGQVGVASALLILLCLFILAPGIVAAALRGTRRGANSSERGADSSERASGRADAGVLGARASRESFEGGTPSSPVILPSSTNIPE
ncbi:MAG: hypothetical protein LBB76_07515, partial [Azoarcus sp.]|nr:hypothetical protein [Azoarcus sp.]